MQKHKNILEAIILNDILEKEPVDSYVKLVKLMSDSDNYMPESFLDRLNISEFIEDAETTYRSYPIKIMYKQLPVILGGEVLVKVVVLAQADSYTLTIPEHISEIYKELLDDPKVLTTKNTDFSLYAEIYGFDSNDKELLDLIKETYLSAGNSLKAFELTGSLKNNVEEPAESSTDAEASPDIPFTQPTSPAAAFPEIQEPVEDFSEIEENSKALKKFKKQSSFLEALVARLAAMSNSTFKENIKIKYLNTNSSILLIEVNNKNIYTKFEHVPAIAKKSLSTLGEAIRKNRDTQLVDSFTKDGKRYFVVAESAGNNFWYVNKEKLEATNTDKDIIIPIQKDIIKLQRSSIRQESRKFLPYKKDKEIVFLKK